MNSPSTSYLPAHRGYPGVVRLYKGLPGWREKIRRVAGFAERAKRKLALEESEKEMQEYVMPETPEMTALIDRANKEYFERRRQESVD